MGKGVDLGDQIKHSLLDVRRIRWGHHLTKPTEEALVKIGESQELLEFCSILGRRSCFLSQYLVRVGFELFGLDIKTKE